VVLIGGTTASATVWWWRHPSSGVSLSVGPEEPAAGNRVRTQRRRRASARAASVSTPVPAPATEPAESPESSQEVFAPAAHSQLDLVENQSTRRLHRQGGRALRSSAEGASSRPTLLLRQASDARRAGDAERAVGLYRKLQQEFPQSSEAILSGVSLGGLLLDRRSSRAALGQFNGYLKASPNGVLTPEALYGKGRALAALGDRAEERRTWERLLSAYPDSAYGPLARRRLAELK
jgi:TolA-binding protein